MTISKDLFLAILSMDSYNRGYGAGLAENGQNDPDGLDVHGSQIGNASISTTLSDVSEGFEAEAQAAGFYAVAYDTPYGTVISYRGTDNLFNWAPWSDTPGSDIWNSYGQGLGDPNANAARLAVEFYQAVTDTTDTDPSSGSAILTGHSMGGGLAGLVGAGERLAA